MQLSSANGDLNYYLTDVFKIINATSKEDRIAEGAEIINMVFASKREVAVAA